MLAQARLALRHAELLARLESAPERQCRLAQHIEVDLELSLDVMLDQLKLMEPLLHPELIRVYDATGLGLNPDGVYRLAFASHMRQQVLVSPSSTEVVRAIVLAALGQVGTDAGSGTGARYCKRRQ